VIETQETWVIACRHCSYKVVISTNCDEYLRFPMTTAKLCPECQESAFDVGHISYGYVYVYIGEDL